MSGMDTAPASPAVNVGAPLDRAAGWVLDRALAPAVAAVAVVLLLTWAPHYLTWPWYSDHDVFATMAQGWDRGLLPYRDTLGNNFPGTIYLFWALGKLFGWGATAPFYAADAALVAAFGAALTAWSRRRLGRALPGLIGFAAFLGFYLDLSYSLVAQRDWHGPALAVLGLLALDARPTRGGRIASALALAAGFAFRPQVVLLLPAVAAMLDEGDRVRTLRAGASWALMFAAGLLLAFAPLVLAGVWGDFLAGIRLVAYGGAYNQVRPASVLKEFLVQFAPARLWAVPAAVALLARWDRPGDRRLARGWLVALAGVALYRPLSPQAHVHLIVPLMLLWSVLLALLVHVLLERDDLAPAARLAAVLLVLGLGVTIKPRSSNPRQSLDALTALARGRPAPGVPAGYLHHPDVPVSAPYPWEDYRRLIAYLREATGPETRVANALKSFPAVTGPAARLPAFPAESAAWFLVVKPDDEGRFAAALEHADDSVVVWIPDEPGFNPYARLAPVIRRLYRPEARFGAIEVWRRR